MNARNFSFIITQLVLTKGRGVWWFRKKIITKHPPTRRVF